MKIKKRIPLEIRYIAGNHRFPNSIEITEKTSKTAAHLYTIPIFSHFICFVFKACEFISRYMRERFFL